MDEIYFNLLPNPSNQDLWPVYAGCRYDFIAVTLVQGSLERILLLYAIICGQEILLNCFFTWRVGYLVSICV